MAALSGNIKKVHAYPSNARVRGTRISTKAGVQIVMGRLVVKGASAGTCSPTVSASAGSEPMGYAMYSERDDAVNSSPYYTSGSPMVVETLVPGMVLNLTTVANIAEGAIGDAGEDGKVRALGASSVTRRRFMANEAITAGNIGEFIVL